MKNIKKPCLTSFIWLFSFLIIFAYSCQNINTDVIKLTNQTAQSVFPLVFTAEQAALIDLNPVIPMDNKERRARVVPPGDSTVLDTDEISDYSSGDGLQFYFYEVIEDTAYFSGGLAVTHDQLLKQQFHVIVDEEEMATKIVQ